MTFNIGDTVGAYKLVKELGRGGMGTVFKAYHAVLDRYVAIKSIHPDLKNDAAFLSRFLREARVVAKLDHPNIVPVYDFSTHGGQPYLVMKFIEGETLKARMKRGLMPLDEVGRVVTAVAAALHQAHKQGVLHRDIKPSNILIEADGDVYLSDFGLARLNDRKGGTSNLIVGTPQYLSPEQARGVDDIDERSDQYSLGVLLFEMVTGRLPFKSKDEMGMIQQHLTTPPPRPSSVRTDLISAIDGVILTALAKDRQARHANVLEMAEAFQRAIRPPEPPVLGTSPTPSPEPGTTPFRKVEDDATRPMGMPIRSGSADDVAVLLVLQPEGTEFKLHSKKEYILGRSDPTRAEKPDLDLANHRGMERGISRRHGRLRFDGQYLFYADLNSSNGSRLNGDRLRPDIPMLVKDGDELALGKMVFRLYYAY